MDLSSYKMLQPSDIKTNVGANLLLEENIDENKSNIISLILSHSQRFIDGIAESTNQTIDFLIKSVPELPEEIQINLLSNFDYIGKLILIDTTDIQQDDLELTLRMIYMVITLPAFKTFQYDIGSVYKFCIHIIHDLIINGDSDDSSINIQLSLECIIELVDQNNFKQLKQNFFEEIRSVCFLTEEISIGCSKIIESISEYVPMIYDFKYYFDFFKYMCSNIHPIFAYNLYLTLFKIIKKYPKIVQIPNEQQKIDLASESHSLPQFWVYEMILDSYRFNHEIKSIAFDICSYLNNDTICILEDPNIKMNILESIGKTENDVRTISAIRALKNYSIINSENCALHYFSVENSTILSPFLIKHIMESSYNIKIEASYLLSFAMQCAPQFFAKGFIKPYSTGLNIKNALMHEEDAIITILSFDKDDLLIRLLHGLIAISDQCLKWGVINELFEAFHDQILPLINDIESDSDEELPKLIACLNYLLIPKEQEE